MFCFFGKKETAFSKRAAGTDFSSILGGNWGPKSDPGEFKVEKKGNTKIDRTFAQICSSLSGTFLVNLEDVAGNLDPEKYPSRVGDGVYCSRNVFVIIGLVFGKF